MSDLMKFYEEFIKHGFAGKHYIQDDHTVILCRCNDIVPGMSLTYVVNNLPSSCSFYVGHFVSSDLVYICVYDD